MKKRLKVVLLFGGKSAEHEVSVRSAKNVYNALSKNKYETFLVFIDKKGEWNLVHKEIFDRNLGKQKKRTEIKIILIRKNSQCRIVSIDRYKEIGLVDVIFPVLHGSFGEDGSMQGYLKILEIPFVGSGVLGSSISMDKDVTKRLFREAGLPTPKFLTFTREDKIDFNKIKKKLSLPLFIKPANLGSSVGVSKVKHKIGFKRAVTTAFMYDNKILIEEYIQGRELECSVLGNEDIKVSLAGEVIPSHEFYDYNAKYIDKNGARLEFPAKLSREKVEEVQHLAKKVFKMLCLNGMARVDFFLSSNGKLYLNEVNTIPGFTNISMFPKLWEISGISSQKLVDELINLALKNIKKDAALQTNVSLAGQ